MKFRLLKPEEIEVRVGTIKENGASLLLYKDARVDMNILDESKEIWKREHFTINNKLFCRVSIYNKELKLWIEREDVGVESNTEATKGEASDSFKRACFNWGIGRELYTAPFIWVDGSHIDMFVKKTDQYGKKVYATYDKFSVKSIDYDDSRNIKSLVIVNDKTKKVVYSFGSTERPPVNKASVPIKKQKWVPSTTKPASDQQREFIANLMRQHGIAKDDMKFTLAERWGINGTLSQADAQMIIDDLNVPA